MAKKKKKPPDRSIFDPKFKSNFITIKTSLKSILKDYDKNFTIIDKLVKDSNHIVVQTYQFIRLYILRQYKNNKNIPELSTENILYFIRAGGTRDNRGRQCSNTVFQKELDDFYNDEFKPLIQREKYNLKNKSYLIPYLAIQIQTAFNNNIKEHFITRLRRFMNITKPDVEIQLDIEDTKKKQKELEKIWNTSKNLVLLCKDNEIHEKYKDWSKWIKDNFLPKECEKNYGYDAKVYPMKYLPYSIKMNEYIETLNSKVEKKEDTKKLFQPISLRNSIVPNYITLDTNVILSTFAGKGEAKLNKNTNDNKEFIWGKIFRTKRRIMKLKGYEFASIQTDGIGVSICFKKSGLTKRELSQNVDDFEEIYITDLTDEDLKKCKDKKIVSIDPGKQNMVFMVDEKGNKLRYTCCQKRIESLRKRNHKITMTEKQNNGIIEKETVLSNYNCKTVDYDKFKDYIKEKTKLNNSVKDFYEQELFRKLKWRSWVYGRKSEDKFLNKAKDIFCESYYDKKVKKWKYNESDLLLSYGNWSNTKQMKHIMPTKGIGMRKLIGKKFNYVMLDEFRTSKLCCSCHKELENYKHIHRMLVCRNCNGSNGSESKNITFINRDINACKNMILLSKDWIDNRSRKKEYCREKE